MLPEKGTAAGGTEERDWETQDDGHQCASLNASLRGASNQQWRLTGVFVLLYLSGKQQFRCCPVGCTGVLKSIPSGLVRTESFLTVRNLWTWWRTFKWEVYEVWDLERERPKKIGLKINTRQRWCLTGIWRIYWESYRRLRPVDNPQRWITVQQNPQFPTSRPWSTAPWCGPCELCHGFRYLLTLSMQRVLRHQTRKSLLTLTQNVKPIFSLYTVNLKSNLTPQNTRLTLTLAPIFMANSSHQN